MPLLCRTLSSSSATWPQTRRKAIVPVLMHEQTRTRTEPDTQSRSSSGRFASPPILSIPSRILSTLTVGLDGCQRQSLKIVHDSHRCLLRTLVMMEVSGKAMLSSDSAYYVNCQHDLGIQHSDARGRLEAALTGVGTSAPVTLSGGASRKSKAEDSQI